jgi:putative transposase
MKKTTTERKKELLGFQVGVQESIRARASRSLTCRSPAEHHHEVAVGDGALGFWRSRRSFLAGATSDVSWVPKMMYILDNIALAVQPKMKQELRKIDSARFSAINHIAFDLRTTGRLQYCRSGSEQSALRPSRL